MTTGVQGVELEQDERRELAQSFVGLHAGSAKIVGAGAEARFDTEEPYLLLSLSLGPPPQAGTWSTDEMFELSQLVRQKLRERGLMGVSPSFVGGATLEETEGVDVGSDDKDTQTSADAGR